MLRLMPSKERSCVSVDLCEVVQDARADVNERMRPGTFFISFVFAAKSLEYRFKGSRSQFCSIAYHHSGATPLMFAILVGNFEVAAALSVRGADARIKNFRGKSAEDLAAETGFLFRKALQVPGTRNPHLFL